MTVDKPTFRVLGPLEVRLPGTAPRLGGPKPRMLLATLLLHANHTVGGDELAEVLWPGHRPRSTAANLRTYASALRAELGQAPARIRALGAGYAIELPPHELDLLLFDERVTAARECRARGRPDEAADLLARALALWQGVPLSDLPGSPLWDRRLERLAQARLRAAEDLVELLMAAGDYGEAVGELRALLADHPFREDLWRRLMLALHWSGRQGEALQAFAAIREHLVTELGVEPGPELRRAHEAVLAGEPPPRPPGPPGFPTASGSPGAASPHGASGLPADPVFPGDPALPGVPGLVVPRQLPPDLVDFTGRAAEVAALTRALAPGGVAVVTGPPGVGKTALAVRCAHAVREAYPHGQLFLSLGGTAQRNDAAQSNDTAQPRDTAQPGDTVSPVEPGELLAEALRALGAAEPLPPTVHERAALYRTLLAERPMLVVLDDAAGAAQVGPLLPGGGSAVVVTGRRRITELPGAARIDLDVLPQAEALGLLTAIVGAERLEREPEEAAAIVRACGRLPLAIRVAGARLAARPGWSPAVLRRRLDDETARLTELRAGDLEVRESFDRSYRLLPDDAARTFRALGLLGTRPLPGWVVDAVLDRHRSDDVTDVLVDANLLRPVGTDPLGQPRYRLPDLLRVDARDKAGEVDMPALARVVAGWTAAAEHATALLPTTVFRLTSPAARRWRLPEDALRRVAADPVSWFGAEHETLVEAVRLAAEAGLAGAAWGLAAALVPYFDLRCHLGPWEETHRVALEAARAAGDRAGEAAMLRGLGQVALYRDRYVQAAGMFRRSRVIFRTLGDVRGEAVSVCGLGAVGQFRGDQAAASRYFRRALGMFVSLDDRSGEAYARQALGRTCLSAGDLNGAADWLGGALRMARELGDAHREGCVSLQIGRLHDLAGETGRAMRAQGRALTIFEGFGDRHCAAYAMQGLGGLQAARGDWRHGSARLESSLAIFRQLGDRSGEAATRRLLGELHRSSGRRALARGYLHAVTSRRGGEDTAISHD
ncbi:BTAD domain-containing putative transcriptional regulator [Microbispora sp. KK1-11]|uniref:AfsR/SARP family transcriptional regulator n=1 Tax=Microbispora sp. KK1-11 TaxID=2053005 RepID=UPI001158FD8D|nr:BTAD domain-containing putative transcriptional regulator [Microbispora sp. KK1-11]TQS23714.1 SARP family transcriptional regulator [Microbispora sp. KK1-11]